MTGDYGECPYILGREEIGGVVETAKFLLPAFAGTSRGNDNEGEGNDIVTIVTPAKAGVQFRYARGVYGRTDRVNFSRTMRFLRVYSRQ